MKFGIFYPLKGLEEQGYHPTDNNMWSYVGGKIVPIVNISIWMRIFHMVDRKIGE